MRETWRIWVPLCLFLVMGTGCSSGTAKTPKLVTVTGKILLDGAPLQGANVIFIPKDNTKGTGGSGVTDAEGKYEARHPSNKAGIEPGTYSVLFSKLAMPDGSPIPEGKNAADVGATESLPQQLSNPHPEYITNVVTVTETGGAFDFTLASK